MTVPGLISGTLLLATVVGAVTMRWYLRRFIQSRDPHRSTLDERPPAYVQLQICGGLIALCWLIHAATLPDLPLLATSSLTLATASHPPPTQLAPPTTHPTIPSPSIYNGQIEAEGETTNDEWYYMDTHSNYLGNPSPSSSRTLQQMKRKTATKTPSSNTPLPPTSPSLITNNNTTTPATKATTSTITPTSLSPVPTSSALWMTLSTYIYELSQIFLLNAWPYCVYATLSVGRALRYPSASSRKHLATTTINIFYYISIVSFIISIISPFLYHSCMCLGYAAFGVGYYHHYRKFSTALSLMPPSSTTIVLRVVFMMAVLSISLQSWANFLCVWDYSSPFYRAWSRTCISLGGLFYIVPVCIWVEYQEYDKTMRQYSNNYGLPPHDTA